MSNGSPFPGIRPFEENESHIFFGRQVQINYLNSSLNKKFVAVIGSSGSGKSSLVKAGLIPRLRKGNWLIVTMKPQRSPIRNLVKTLTEANWNSRMTDEGKSFAKEVELTSKENAGVSIAKVVSFSKVVEFNISLSSNGIVETYIQSGTENRLLLIVDQFEELFNFKDEKIDNKSDPAKVEEALKFVNLLTHAANSSHKVYILITMRSEFLGNCSEFKGLPELINEGQFLIPRLTRTQFKDAIVKPLELYDATISASLVSQMLNDIEYDPDQLPVLQHSLMRIWNNFVKTKTGSDRVITIDAYNAVGGMTNAINQHAEEVLEGLKKVGIHEEVRIILQRITKRSPTGVGVRSPKTFKELVDVAGGSRDNVEKVIDSFRKEGVNFLTPPFPEPLEDTTDIDISHETLIRKWNLLRDWIQYEDDDKRKLLKLVEYEDEYKRDRQNFLRGSVLNGYLNWPKYKEGKKKGTVVWASLYTSRFSHLIDFIDKCVKEKEKEQSREEKIKRRVRWSIGIAISLGIACIILFLIFTAKQAERENEVLLKTLSMDSLASRNYKLQGQITQLRDSFLTVMQSRATQLTTSENELTREIGRQKIEVIKYQKIANDEKAQAQEAIHQASLSQERLIDAIESYESIRKKASDDSTRYTSFAAENQTLRERRDQLQREVYSLRSASSWAINSAELMTLYYLSSKSPGDTSLTADERHLINSNLSLLAKRELSTIKFKVSLYSDYGEKSTSYRAVLNVLKKENQTVEVLRTMYEKTAPMTILYFQDENINFAYRIRKILQQANLDRFRIQRGSTGKGGPLNEVLIVTD